MFNKVKRLWKSNQTEFLVILLVGVVVGLYGYVNGYIPSSWGLKLKQGVN